MGEQAPTSGPVWATPPRVVALILAAGQATRFGSDKRQARLPDGRSMLEAVVSTHREVFDEVCVLTRHRAPGHAEAPPDAFVHAVCEAHGARCVVCDAALGLGHTLAHGLNMLRALPDPSARARPVDAALVSLADMPWVQADTLRCMLDRFALTGQVVVPRHGDALGHPRLLPMAVWPLLLGLKGDRGARSLLDWSVAEQVLVDDPGVLRDVDTPADIMRP